MFSCYIFFFLLKKIEETPIRLITKLQLIIIMILFFNHRKGYHPTQFHNICIGMFFSGAC